MTSSASNRKQHAFAWLELYILNSPLRHAKRTRRKGKHEIKIFSNSQNVPNENKSDLEIAFGTIYSCVWGGALRAGWPPQPWAMQVDLVPGELLAVNCQTLLCTLLQHSDMEEQEGAMQLLSLFSSSDSQVKKRMQSDGLASSKEISMSVIPCPDRGQQGWRIK